MSMGKQGAGHGSGMSSVGNAQAYGSDDQVTVPRAVEEENKEVKAHAGHGASHHLPAEHQKQWGHKHKQSEEKKIQRNAAETQQVKKDPTMPAIAHGNKPSKGARIDASLQAEEEEELRRKGKLA